jgi:ketosteroid isomerase-like protein
VRDKEAAISNTDIVRAWIEAFESHDFDGAGDLLADDFVFAGPVPEPIGKPEFIALHRAKAAKNPNERVTATMRDDKVARFDVEEVPGAGVGGLLSRVGVDMPALA